MAGLRLIEEVQPDIVVIDIQMPGFNGLEVIGKMREQKKNIQFIIISGYSQFEYARQALRYGVKDYLLKPVMKEEMEGRTACDFDTYTKDGYSKDILAEAQQDFSEI